MLAFVALGLTVRALERFRGSYPGGRAPIRLAIPGAVTGAAAGGMLAFGGLLSRLLEAPVGWLA